MKKLITPLLIIPFIAACGSSDDDSGGAPSASVKTGYFIDSAVTNVEYSTATQSGRTSSKGGFQYIDGETVTFSIGDIDFPSASSKPQISPVDLVENGTVDSTEVVNIARLLQTLDSDGDPSNGITIDETVHDAAASISIDFSNTDFDNDQTVKNFVADAVSETATLVSVADAKAHLSNTLDNLMLIIDAELKLDYADTDNNLSPETISWENKRLIQSEKFVDSGQNISLNVEYHTDLDTTTTITLNTNGTGSIYDGSPITEWSVNNSGQIEFTEKNDGEEWTFILTKIEVTDGYNLLIEIDAPANQADYSRGMFLAKIVEDQPE